MSITITNIHTGVSRRVSISNGIALVRLERTKQLSERTERKKRNLQPKPVAMRRRCSIAACEPTEKEIGELGDLGIEYADLESLSSDERAVTYLTTHQHLIDWHYFSANARAIDFLLCNLHYVDADAFSLNPCAASFLMDNPHWIRWKYVTLNPSATDIILDNFDKIDQELLKLNPSYTSIICQKVMRDVEQYIGCFPKDYSDEEYSEHSLPFDYRSDDEANF